MNTFIVEVTYVIAAICFITGLKYLSHPDTARKGNYIGATGMAIAIIATLFFYRTADGERLGNYPLIFAGMLIGAVAGWLSAKKVKMTAMPQMVAIFNGMGGGCSALIGLVEFPNMAYPFGTVAGPLATFASIIVGSVTFSGSMIAFAKLNGNLNKDIRFPFYNIVNLGMLATAIGLMICLLLNNIPDPAPWVYVMLAVAFIYGILFVIPIGGADMPVVIAWLNSLSGIAATFAGFIYGNLAMIICGILVGASGIILTFIMCHAMNRSFANVFFTAFGSTSGGASSGKGDQTIREVSASDSAVMMYFSKRVVMVPGYGLAVAQAQHAMHELESLLVSNGVDVKYAIHPVAGRMPGHMNVLLAEANVDYDKLVEMDAINPHFPNTDVVLVVGANDVVNPAALTDPSSPIYGMPILEVNKSKKVIIVKRSMNVGYAGIGNDLFYDPIASMLFGDAKAVLTRLIEEMKAL